jgi:hypothetical protein
MHARNAQEAMAGTYLFSALEIDVTKNYMSGIKNLSYITSLGREIDALDVCTKASRC